MNDDYSPPLRPPLFHCLFLVTPTPYTHVISASASRVGSCRDCIKKLPLEYLAGNLLSFMMEHNLPAQYMFLIHIPTQNMNQVLWEHPRWRSMLLVEMIRTSLL